MYNFKREEQGLWNCLFMSQIVALREARQDIKTVSIFKAPRLGDAHDVKKGPGGRLLPQSTVNVTCDSKHNFCMVDRAKINYKVLITYAYVRVVRPPDFPFLDGAINFNFLHFVHL
jgi:hypothetical protein